MSTPPPPPPGDWPAGEPYATPAVPDETLVAPAPVGPPPPEEPGNRIGKGMLLGIAALAIIAAVLAAIFLTRNNNHKKPAATTVVVTTTTPTTTAAAVVQVPVPSLVGISKADALTQLQRAGFKPALATVPGPPPSGHVISQSPTAGTKAPHGSVVRLNVSSGAAKPATTTVAATTTVPATTTATAAATTTAPATTTAAATTTTASAPPQPTSAQVPSFSGDMGSAIVAISQAGFPVSIKYVPNDQPLGTVVAQSPSAGQTKPTTAHITITVSEGPGKNPLENVPDVTGKTVPEALAAFHAVGLRLVEQKRYITDKTQIGKIVEQTPTGGQAPKNAQILVYWGAFKKS